VKLIIPKGSTSRIITVFIQANNVTNGAGLSGLTNASGIVGGYVREGSTGVALTVDEDVTTEGTYQAPSAAGKVRIGTPANMRSGTYELHFHNNLWATGAEGIVITLGGATNMADIAIEVQLIDPVRGLAGTALPNAAADAAGGLIISDAGGLDADALRADIVAILTDTGTTLDGKLDIIGVIVDAILTDTGTTLPTILAGLATQASVDVIDAIVDQILADTGTDGVALSAATLLAIADTLLNRDLGAGTDDNTRSLRNAVRFLRNKWSITGTTLSVTKEDDTTLAWDAVLTAAPGADPISGSDPT